MKLKVLDIEETPENCTRRAVLLRDGFNQDWIRDQYDHLFLLWSNSVGHRGDRIYNANLKKLVEVDSPFEPVLDEDGYETGESRPREGLIIIPVDVYEHSGIVWFLRGEAPAGCCCRWDSTCYSHEAPFYLYCDEKRWKEYGGNSKWEFKDGKPTDELYKEARKIAREEVKEMNLCEEGSYYGYKVEEKITEESDVRVRNEHDGSEKAEHRKSVFWDEEDACWGYLTDKPAEEVDFPIGIPVVSPDEYISGDTFDQECYALATESGEFVKFKKDGHEFVKEPWQAFLVAKGFLDDNLKHYEDELKTKLKIVDVTEKVWSRYPECIVK